MRIANLVSMMKTWLFLFGLAGCGGIAIIDDGAGGAGTTTSTAVSVVSASSGADYPCTAPTGPGLGFGELCLTGTSAPCPPLSEALDQQFLEQVLGDCEQSFSRCCPVWASAWCGPNPNAAGCCYMVQTATPPQGCI